MTFSTRRRAAAVAALMALALPGCVPYSSSYVRDESTRVTSRSLDRQAVASSRTRLAVTSAPSPSAAGTPFSVRVSRILEGPEVETSTVAEKSYKGEWSPLYVIPGALATVVSPPVLAVTSLMDDSRVHRAFAGTEGGRPCEGGLFAAGLRALLGLRLTCEERDSRQVVERSLTGRTVSVEEPAAGAPVEFRLSIPGDAPMARSGPADGAGGASLDVAQLFRGLASGPRRAELSARVLPDGSPSVSVAVEGETARLLFLPVSEERAGDAASREGKGLAALERYSVAHAFSLGEKEREATRRKLFAVYRSLLVKPRPPEATRRLLEQAEALSKSGDAAGAGERLKEALKATPWSQAARYGIALVHAAERDYAGAIAQMRSFLELVPEGAEAREARERIREWEGMASIPGGEGAVRSPAASNGRGAATGDWW